MNINDYVNAVDKLEFSKDFLKKVRNAAYAKRGFRTVRAAAMAAVLILIMAGSVLGVVCAMRERPGDLVEIGSAGESMEDAEIMNFRVSRGMEGVTIHYMELEPNKNYSFRHGMLRTGRSYQYITQDYQLESVELKRVDASLKKNDREYRLGIDYLETEKGILSDHRSVYQKNESGEILLCATDGNSGQWPVYLNIETGEIRDALADWRSEDFTGRIGYAYVLRGGILVCTVVEETDSFAEAYGQQGSSHSLLYWIAPGAKEARRIGIPTGAVAHVENNTVYYQDQAGHLFAMDEEFEFRQISEYRSTDSMQDGLMTVSVRGKLGIVDAFSGDTYVFDELDVRSWELTDYEALRYGNNGTVALVKTRWLHEPERIALTSLGMLNRETGELKMLRIENDCDGYRHAWLDENRFAVIYRSGVRQYLCIYEFTE